MHDSGSILKIFIEIDFFLRVKRKLMFHRCFKLPFLDSVEAIFYSKMISMCIAVI